MNIIHLSAMFHSQVYYHSTGWFGHTILTAIIHGLIYGVIFKIMHALGLFGSIIFVVLVLGGIGAGIWYKNKRRYS